MSPRSCKSTKRRRFDSIAIPVNEMKIKIHYLENEARKSNGLKGLNWEERTIKLTNKGRHEYSKW